MLVIISEELTVKLKICLNTFLLISWIDLYYTDIELFVNFVADLDSPSYLIGWEPQTLG
jgi:hypothetical protein